MKVMLTTVLKYSAFVAVIATLMILFVVPQVSFAEETSSGIVPNCSGETGCGYCELGELGGNIIKFLIEFGILVAILSIVYSGFLYVTAGANPTQITKAHANFRAAIIGLIIVLAAWLIINMIATTLIEDKKFFDPTLRLPGCAEREA